ncbi:hypothetical protein BDF19DRAFT_413227 [Syncephalis fuscata]|nr:hypothetical protein BDF19DRAFT_413227 [Syncephalis fuscata]
MAPAAITATTTTTTPTSISSRPPYQLPNEQVRIGNDQLSRISVSSGNYPSIHSNNTVSEDRTVNNINSNHINSHINNLTSSDHYTNQLSNETPLTTPYTSNDMAPPVSDPSHNYYRHSAVNEHSHPFYEASTPSNEMGHRHRPMSYTAPYPVTNHALNYNGPTATQSNGHWSALPPRPTPSTTTTTAANEPYSSAPFPASSSASSHYVGHLNSRYSVSSLQRHETSGDDNDSFDDRINSHNHINGGIHRQSTVSPPVSTVAFSQVSYPLSSYSNYSQQQYTTANGVNYTDQNSTVMHYQQPQHFYDRSTAISPISTGYRDSIDSSMVHRNDSATSYAYTANSSHTTHSPNHRRVVSSDQLPANTSTIPIASSLQQYRPRHMSQGELPRPFSPISLDIIDDQLLRNPSRTTSRDSEPTSTEYSPRDSVSSLPPRPDLRPRHSSSSAASSRPSTVFVQSVAGAQTSQVPLAFPLISRSDRPTIASPLPDPGQRTREAHSNGTVEALATNGGNNNDGDGPAVSTLLVARPTSKNGKFKLSMRFDRPFFCAGGMVTGRAEIQCQSSSVRIGEISIEVIGIEGN